MLKFFRKYNTLILVVGGVFLMIAFLVPQALQQFGSQGMFDPRAFSAGETIYRQSDVTKAGRENAVLSETLLPLVGFEQAHRVAMGVESTEHWILLSRMAERMGLYNPGGTPEDILPRALAEFGFSVTEEEVDQTLLAFENAAIAARDRKIALDALRHMDAIIRLRSLYGFSNLLSDRELALIASNLYTTVEANLGVVSGEAYADTLEPLTEEELREHYEEYRTARPDENHFGFSYRLPDALRFEVLAIDRGIIEDAIELDPIEVRTFHRQNVDSGRYDDDFRAVRSLVESDLRARKTTEVMNAIKAAVNKPLVQAQSRLERTDRGLRELPDDWAQQRPSFDELAEAANEAAGRLLVTSEAPARVLRFDDEWMSREDIRNTPDLLSLRIQTATGLTPISSALFRLPEFNVQQPLADAQVGVTIRGLVEGISATRPGDEGFVRVLDARLEGPSTSIEQVRDEVERDAKALRGYRALEDRMGELVEQASEGDGLVGAVLELADEGAYVTTNAIVRYYDVQSGREAIINVETNAQTPADIDAQRLANYPSLAEAVVDHVITWDPRIDVAALPIGRRVLGVMVPESQSLAIVAIMRRRPVTQDQMRRLYNATSVAFGQRVSVDDPSLQMSASLTLEALRDRFDYVDLREDAENEGVDEDETDETEAEPGGETEQG